MKEHVDVLRVILLYTNRFSLLPEIYEIFGEKQLLKFLDVFAGTIIEVPPAEVIERAVRDVTIFIRMKKATDDNRGKVVKLLADELLVSEDFIRSTYKEVTKAVEQNLGFKVLLDTKEE